jgi:hypothetical protein
MSEDEDHKSNDFIALQEISLVSGFHMVEKEKEDINQDATRGISDLPTRNEIEEASRENGIHWAQSYTKLMDTSIRQAHHMAVTKGWSLIDCRSTNSNPLNILLYDGYSADGGVRANYYKLKVRGVFKVRPERLHYVVKDHNPETRSRWDKQHFVSCNQLETFCISETESSSENIHVVSSESKLNIPFAWNRACLGIQWSGFDEMTGVYKHVFRTTQHRLYRPAANVVQVQGLAATFIRVLDDDNEECDFTCVLHVNIGDSFPFAMVEQWNMKEWLRKRVELYVRVAQQWDMYYKDTDDPKKYRK